MPVEILNLDLDRDGVRDLTVVVGSTTWGETAFEEETRLDEGTLVDVLTVVPTLLDRRELLWFRGRAEGGFETAPRADRASFDGSWSRGRTERRARSSPGPTKESPKSCSSGGRAVGGESLTVAPEPAAGEPRPSSSSCRESPRCRCSPAVARSFRASGSTRDIDGDGEVDLLLPVERGLEVYRGSADGIATAPAVLLETPADFLAPATRKDRPRSERKDEDEPEVRTVLARSRRARDVFLPELVDLDGDRRLGPPLSRSVVRRLGSTRPAESRRMAFGTPFDPLGDSELEDGREVVWVGQLDGTAGAELVTSEEIQNEKDSMRAELAEAKRPRARLRVHRLEQPRHLGSESGFDFRGRRVRPRGRRRRRDGRRRHRLRASRGSRATSTATGSST